MASRIQEVRQLVRSSLEAKGTWYLEPITDQIGMFSFTGLTAAQCSARSQAPRVPVETGRISLAGLNKGNVDYFVNAVDDAVHNA